eukprot:CAMPEP_0183337310 /NCGR_PEP_ID=MMETSP0164_2-20130417/4999_1 /TAXON_ID=221442 /ORGANISM="Coccolithus pelagicus ssp braarudi, Strain PLY182g" /LENGTH=97 /DNA_ID=CAMNT_0025506977 /DNA_START=332 /DNA_END=622 /DNA_ORIENTATION=+
MSMAAGSPASCRAFGTDLAGAQAVHAPRCLRETRHPPARTRVQLAPSLPTKRLARQHAKRPPAARALQELGDLSSRDLGGGANLNGRRVNHLHGVHG